MTIRIALVGDFDETVTAHRAIPLAIAHAAQRLNLDVHFDWLATDAIQREQQLSSYHGIWCVPASPYRSMDGALMAIRFAREQPRAFFGSCGGFQHAIIEYARNVLHWHDADHAETAPDSQRTVIAPLSCALVEVEDRIQLMPNTHLASAYHSEFIREAYRCRFGLNRAFEQTLLQGVMHCAAVDQDGEVRAVEIPSHPFFVATLFQPERAALRGEAVPIVQAFVAAAQGISTVC